VAALHQGKRGLRNRRQHVQPGQRLQALLKAGQRRRPRERRELRDARVARVAQPGAARVVALVQALCKRGAGLLGRGRGVRMCGQSPRAAHKVSHLS